MKFKVGDRVRYVGKAFSNFGKIGTIEAFIEAFSKDPLFGKEALLTWDDGTEPLFISLDYLELIKPEKPKVTEETMNCYIESIFVNKVIWAGRKTIVLYKDDRVDSKTHRSIAKCNPNDKYDKYKGYHIALNRAIISASKRTIAATERRLAVLTK